MINENDTILCYEKLIEFYESFNSIDEYFRIRKFEKLKNINDSKDLFGKNILSGNFFNDYTISPLDMDFRIEEAGKDFMDMVQIVSSMAIGISPGRSLKIKVIETNTNQIVGFIKMGSPPLNMAPRNKLFGKMPSYDELNNNIYNGFTFVPVQPFGFNYLGGKLLSLIGCTLEVKEIFDRKFDCDINLMETTSLYGSIKHVSQYDGLKPFIRYGGYTDSKSDLFPSDEVYKFLSDTFRRNNNGNHVTDNTVSNKKTKRFNIMMSEIKKLLKKIDIDKYNKLVNLIKCKRSIQTQKRYYYGNVDKSLDQVITWWKKKATKRFNNLKKDGRLRTKMEIWTPETLKNDSIDIIR